MSGPESIPVSPATKPDVALTTAPTAPGARFYLPQLDGLRFLAAAVVFFSHTEAVNIPGFKQLQSVGWCGVDLFLVLSAFLLTRLIVLEYQTTGTIDIKHFYIRRLLRIWPLHWAFVTAMLGVHYFLYSDSIKAAIGFWLSHIFFINNVLLATLGFESRLAFTSHLWTVSLEEQFYLVIPLVLGLLLRSRVSPSGLLRGLIAVLLAIMGMRAACALVGLQYPFLAAMPLRGDTIVIGVFLGVAFPYLRLPGSGTLRFAAGLVVLALFTLLPSVEIPGWQQVPGYTLIALGCTLLLTGVFEDNALSRLLATRPLRYLGKISFGIYVYHMLCLAVGKRVAERLGIHDWWGNTLLAAALTIGAASLSYHIYEKRFLVFKERFSTIKSRPA